jgi:hypothetical protein
MRIFPIMISSAAILISPSLCFAYCSDLQKITIRNDTGLILSTSTEEQWGCWSSNAFKTDSFNSSPLNGMIMRDDQGLGHDTWVKVVFYYNQERIAEYKYLLHNTHPIFDKLPFFNTWIADHLRNKFAWVNLQQSEKEASLTLKCLIPESEGGCK